MKDIRPSVGSEIDFIPSTIRELTLFLRVQLSQDEEEDEEVDKDKDEDVNVDVDVDMGVEERQQVAFIAFALEESGWECPVPSDPAGMSIPINGTDINPRVCVCVCVCGWVCVAYVGYLPSPATLINFFKFINV